VVVVCALPLIFIWKGLVPPKVQRNFHGLVFEHLVFSMGYAGICMLIIAPQSLKLRPPYFVVVALASAGLAYLLSNLSQLPLRSVMEAHLSSELLQIYSFACGLAFGFLGLCFTVSVVNSIASSKDRIELVTKVGLLVCAIAPLFMAAQYSSRYTAMALPFLILYATQSENYNSPYRVPLLILGNALGFLSLFSYYFKS
jgi:hypothetical protein